MKRIQTPPPDDDEDEAGDNHKDGPHTGLSSDDAISELTELSDDETQPEEQAAVKAEEAPVTVQERAESPQPKEKKTEEGTESFGRDTTNHIPDDFIEWEAVSCTPSDPGIPE